jgi:hypothetical protein
MSLLFHLPYGEANATSIPALARASGMSQREVRAEIERLVIEDHIPVVCFPTNPGVFIAVTIEEARRGRKQIRSRAGALLRRGRALGFCEPGVAKVPEMFPGVR